MPIDMHAILLFRCVILCITLLWFVHWVGCLGAPRD